MKYPEKMMFTIIMRQTIGDFLLNYPNINGFVLRLTQIIYCSEYRWYTMYTLSKYHWGCLIFQCKYKLVNFMSKRGRFITKKNFFS